MCGQMDKQIDKLIDQLIEKHKVIDFWMDRQTDRLVAGRQINKYIKINNKDGWIDGQADRQIGLQID